MRQSTKYVVEKIFVVIERLREKKGLPKPVIDKDLLKQTESTLHSSYSQKDK